MFRTIVWALLAFLILTSGFAYLAFAGFFGRDEGPGEVTGVAVPADVVAARTDRNAQAFPEGAKKHILFGDFHVHTTISGDAFSMSLPILGGEGTRPQADACDYARYCSSLDFFSLNDHAEELTPRRWRDTIDTVRQCNDVSEDPDNPDLVSFLGWEWTQMGNTRETHYGHRNVILAGIEDEDIPTRPIAAQAPQGVSSRDMPAGTRTALALLMRDARALDLMTYWSEVERWKRDICAAGVPVRELPADCFEATPTPAGLFEKLDDWDVDSIVIPHGTTWGNYTPPSSDWSKQLIDGNHDPDRQRLLEVYSGHGSAEVYRHWLAAEFDYEGGVRCPAPTDDYLPTCWQAGEIMRQRCLDAGLDAVECDHRAAHTRDAAAERGSAAHLVAGSTDVEDWLDAGQCRDCFIPAFNYRPLGSAQAILSLGNFTDPESPQRFRFGFIGSSDNHQARAGNGFKDSDRIVNADVTGFVEGKRLQAEPYQPLQPDLVDVRAMNAAQRAEVDRINSFFSTGGLIAAHADSRSRAGIWQAVASRNVYGTSGDRMLLWFDMEHESGLVPMGSEVSHQANPAFRVKAVGAYKQKPGCPDYARTSLGEERLQSLCLNECFNPSTDRKLIERIEVVRIRPQVNAQENPLDLIDDPWLVHTCEPMASGCELEFSDDEFAERGRDQVYYVRAIQEASNAVNGNNLRCERDEEGNCINVKPCHGHEDLTEFHDDCLAPVNERAWSSPIYVDFQAAAPTELPNT